ncbi:MAG: hypothetical protein H6818_05370 [Phycisphaerales bacterium]|nr:hypothetical protein [Phycisphaerales bacterium]MCB9863385.1 hypothetical protein [Phycisphaerales bacterium]
MKRLTTIIGIITCGLSLSGCDVLFGSFVIGDFFDIGTALSLANHANQSLNVGLYFTNDANLSEQQLREQGEIVEVTLPPGSEMNVERDFIGLEQFMVGSAFFTGSTEDTSSSVFRRGSDFDVESDGSLADSFTLTFTGDEKPEIAVGN